MTFAHPWRLLLLGAVALLALAWTGLQKRRRARLARIARAALPQGLGPSPRERSQVLLAALGLGLCAVALARPRYGEREMPAYSRGRNVMIVVDVSRSMLATDVRPNRLERARADLRDLLAELRGDRAGLIAFRRGAALACPLTDDLRFLRMALEGLTTDSAPRGETDIAAGIRAALDALEPFPGDHNAIVLVSDGEDLRGEALQAARTAAERGIPIFSVGIGDVRGATIPLEGGRRLQHDGDEVTSRLDNQTLREIAALTGGSYIPLETAGTGHVTLGTLYRRHLREVAAEVLREDSERRLVERFQWALIPAVLCFLGVGLLSPGRPSWRRAVALASALAWLLAPAAVRATDDEERPPDPPAPAAAVATGRDRAREALAALRAGRPAEAAEGFLAAAAAPDLPDGVRRDIRFNAGLALLRAGRFEEAAAVLEPLQADPDAPASLRELLGAARFRAATAVDDPPAGETPDDDERPEQRRLRWLEGAAEAFQEVLHRRQSDAPRGRRNLAAAMAGIPELREHIRLQDVLDAQGDRPAEALLAELFAAQRKGTTEAAEAVQTAGPELIGRLESVAARQREAADLWLALAPRLLEAIDGSQLDDQERAALRERLLRARGRMLAAADDLEDLDTRGLEALGRNEAETLEWLTMVAPPPMLLDASWTAQQDALEPHEAAAAHARRGGVERQLDAQGLLRRFQERFAGWADARQDGGEEPIAPDDRAEIERLTAAALDLQAQAVSAAEGQPRLSEPALDTARQALERIERIRELMPKPPSQPQPSDSPPPDGEPPPDDGSEDPPPGPQDPDDAPDDEGASDAPPEEPDEEPPPDEPAEAPREDDQALDPEELERLLDRALQREREREEALRRSRQPLPPLLNERDW